jgi:hypothetical protein
VKTEDLRNRIVIVLWTIVLVIICIRVGVSYRQHNAFLDYVGAGRKWIESQPLYSTTRGFVYSPLIAAFFALFAWLPEPIDALIWRLLNVSIFVGAICWWLTMRLHNQIPKKSTWLVFLLLLPLTVGNFNNGQVNPLLTGLLMFAVLAAYSKQWTIAAICLGLAAYLKIYPLAIGLLLALIYPRQLAWRLAVILIFLGALTFLFQQPAYVLEQYQRWFSSRSADKREITKNLGVVLKALHASLSPSVFMAIQVLAGAVVAVLCLFGRIREWAQERLLVGMFTLGSCWMLLFGPATEGATYVLLAPALVFALVQAFHQNTPHWMRNALCLSFVLILLGQVLDSYFIYKKGVYSMSLQPFGGLIFMVCALFWVFTSSLWTRYPAEERVGSPVVAN